MRYIIKFTMYKLDILFSPKFLFKNEMIVNDYVPTFAKILHF